ncbi:MAG: alpha/beta hydrolase [Acidobacteriota bacterium]
MPPLLQKLVFTTIRVGLRCLAVVMPRPAGRLAYRIFSTPRSRARVPAAAVDIMARAERVTLDVDGEQVAAYRWTRGDEERPRAVIAHGWESRAARLVVWVEPLLDAGFEVVSYDAPAHGESEGRVSDPLRFCRALLATADHFGPIDVAVGHSLGTIALVLSVVGGRRLGYEDLSIERMVIVGGADSGVDAMAMFCDLLGLGEGFLPLLLDGAADAAGGHSVASFDVHRIFVDRPIPVFWQHDRDDTAVPLAAAQRVDAACPHVELLVTEGLGHHAIARDPEVIRRAVDFLLAEPSRRLGLAS